MKDDDSEESRGTWAMVCLAITLFLLMIYSVLDARGLL